MNWNRGHSPPWKGGEAAPTKKCSRSLVAQTGWLLCETKPPRPLPLRWLCDIFFGSQPPLLSKEGNAHDSNSFTPSKGHLFPLAEGLAHQLPPTPTAPILQ